MTIGARKIWSSATGVRERAMTQMAMRAAGVKTRSCVLIDDHETLREGAAAVLARAGVAVVAEIDCAPCAADLDACPELVVVDLQYNGSDERCRAVQGADAVALVAAHWPSAQLLVYTSSACDRCAVAAMAAGAHGFVRKGEGNAALAEAAIAVLDGGAWVPAWLARLIEQADARGGHAFGLTERQLEVLRHVARGLTHQQVANKLGVSLDTVKEHLAALRTRMQAVSTIDAVRLGAEAGLVAGFAPPEALACACWVSQY